MADVSRGITIEWERKGNAAADMYAKRGAYIHGSFKGTAQGVQSAQAARQKRQQPGRAKKTFCVPVLAGVMHQPSRKGKA